MADIVFNVYKGRIAHYGTLPAANDAFIMVLLKSSGLQADATLADHDDLAALLAATNDEADCSGYSRQTLANVTVTVDDTNDRVDIDCDDVAFGALSAGNTLAKAVICYDPDTTSGTDSTVVPITAHDITLTTDGSSVTLTIPSGGFARAS